MLELTYDDTNKKAFFLHAGCYCFTGATKLVLSYEEDPSASPALVITDNCNPESFDLFAEHFFLSQSILDNERVFPLLLKQRIIEPVEGDMVHPDGRSAYRLCAGVLPDTDSRRRQPYKPIEMRNLERALAHILSGNSPTARLRTRARP